MHERCLNPDCRRILRDPKSQARGFGRKCWRDRQPVPLGAVIRTLPIARRAAEVVDGQLAIDEEVDGGDL